MHEHTKHTHSSPLWQWTSTFHHQTKMVDLTANTFFIKLLLVMIFFMKLLWAMTFFIKLLGAMTFFIKLLPARTLLMLLLVAMSITWELNMAHPLWT